MRRSWRQVAGWYWSVASSAHAVALATAVAQSQQSWLVVSGDEFDVRHDDSQPGVLSIHDAISVEVNQHVRRTWSTAADVVEVLVPGPDVRRIGRHLDGGSVGDVELER